MRKSVEKLLKRIIKNNFDFIITFFLVLKKYIPRVGIFKKVLVILI